MLTIKDIANMANVSAATVSRVINNPELVSSEKKLVVQNVIKEHNYQPNGLARGLIKKMTHTIGVIIPDINNLFYPAVVRGIEDLLEENNYSVFLCNTDKKIEKEMKYINVLMEKRVDGLILMGTRSTNISDNKHLELFCSKVPIVLINETLVGMNVYSVLTDEIEGAYNAVSYLIGLGHKKIAYIAGEEEYSTYYNKQMGYETALKNHHIDINEAYIVHDLPYPEGGYRAANKLFECNDIPTAVFAASDQIAMGVIKATFDSGRKVPDDISVIGFANIPSSKDIYPELTTVDQFPYQTGYLATEVMLDLVHGKTPPQKKFILEPKLLIRSSCNGI